MTEFLAVIIITIVAVISPGPDFAMVTRNSLMLSRRSGVFTAFGIGLGVLIHVSYTLIGVGVLIKNSIWLFDVIKFTGALYLIYLGLKMVGLKDDTGITENRGAPRSVFAAMRIGFLTNALNPKTTVFIVSLFMQVVKPDTSLMIQISYGLFISIAHIIWFSIVAVSFSSKFIRERFLSARHWLDRTFGGLMIVFGIILTTVSRP
jgi:RhtB (resistance to homoserine/threonine) family protein